MLLNVVKHCGEYLFYSYFSRYSLFVNNDKHKILDLRAYNLLGCWNFNFGLGSNICAWVKYLRSCFFGVCRSYMSTSLCKRQFFQLTQPHSKSEQLEWGFWRILGNSPHLEEHHNYLSPVLKPLFNSFMWCQVLALSARPHNLLITTNL